MTLPRHFLPGLTLALVLLIGPAPLARTAAPTDGQATDSPRRGGTLRLRFPADWQSLDPALAYDSDSASLLRLLFRCLLQYDYQGNLHPDEAESWSVSPDGRTYRFTLRPDRRFADGTPVTSEDYRFALERVLDRRTRSPGQALYTGIRGAQEFVEQKTNHVAGILTPDPHSLIIELERPSFTFRYTLCLGFSASVPRHHVARHGDRFRYHLVGSGPYVVREWKRESHWKFARNPHFTGTNGFVDGIEISLGGDPMLQAMQVERGEIDLAYLSPVLRRRFQRDPALASWIRLVNPVSAGFLFLNNGVKPFDDVRVRRAMNHAIDQVRVNRATGGLTTPAFGIVPTNMPWSNPDLHRYQHDPERARALLREAGFPDGFKTTLWYLLTRESDRLVVAAIQQDLAQVGIQAELQAVPLTAMEQATRTPGRIPCGLWGWYQDFPDPSNFIEPLFHQDGIRAGNNWAFFANPAIDRLIESASATLEPALRIQRFRETENRILQEAPWVPIFYDNLAYAVHPRIRGFRPHPVWLRCYEDLWISEP